MALNRGDIIDVFFEFPKVKNTTTHPAIIISNQEVYEADDGYICVIMTSSNYIDQFTFELTNEMLQKSNTKSFSQARCHMITFVHEKHIFDRYPKNTLKPNAVERLIAHLNEVSFSDDY